MADQTMVLHKSEAPEEEASYCGTMGGFGASIVRPKRDYPDSGPGVMALTQPDERAQKGAFAAWNSFSFSTVVLYNLSFIIAAILFATTVCNFIQNHVDGRKGSFGGFLDKGLDAVAKMYCDWAWGQVTVWIVWKAVGSVLQFFYNHFLYFYCAKKPNLLPSGFMIVFAVMNVLAALYTIVAPISVMAYNRTFTVPGCTPGQNGYATCSYTVPAELNPRWPWIIPLIFAFPAAVCKCLAAVHMIKVKSYQDAPVLPVAKPVVQ